MMGNMKVLREGYSNGCAPNETSIGNGKANLASLWDHWPENVCGKIYCAWGTWSRVA